MAFPWDTLIAAAAGIIGALGGAGVNGHYYISRERRAADRADIADRETRRRDAYASLLVTARAALRNFQRIHLAYLAETPDIPEVTEALGEAGAIMADLSRAAALAAMLGSTQMRQHSDAVYDAATACADLYRRYAVASGWLKAEGYPDFLKFSGENWDNRGAKLCDDLAATIQVFTDAAHREINSGDRLRAARAAAVRI
jgi:hypothetical protein